MISLSCDLDYLNKLSFPHPMEAELLASIGLAVSKEKKFENVEYEGP